MLASEWLKRNDANLNLGSQTKGTGSGNDSVESRIRNLWLMNKTISYDFIFVELKA